MTENTFKNQLQKSVKKIIILSTITLSIGFFLVFYISNYQKYKSLSEDNLNYIEENFVNLYNSTQEYLLDESTNIYCADAILKADKENFTNSFNRFNRKNKVKAKYMITDINSNLISTSFSIEELTPILNYSKAINYKAQNNDENGVYSSVYSTYAAFPDLILSKPINNFGKNIGFLTVFLSGNDWSFNTSNTSNYFNIVTDDRDRVIFYNRAFLVKNTYKFSSNNSSSFLINDQRYWIEKKSLKDLPYNIYSLINYPLNLELYVGLVMIFLIGISTYFLAKWMSNKMAIQNSNSIDKLSKEIKTISKNPKHRISINSNDEFEEVANKINIMLDRIEDLNDKNTELIKFNNSIEISQLTAQINPHFLYNTLEMIRSLISYDQTLAKEIIMTLNKVLRYSINNNQTEVLFEDDLDFMEQYFFIQKLRFADRLKIILDIEENAKNAIVPKLFLQPLVENSIKYGFMKQTLLKIEIKAFMEDDCLHIEVRDDGPGMDNETYRKISQIITSDKNDSNSYGLFNIARRIKLQSNKESYLKIENYEGQGVTIKIKLEQKDGDFDV